jgi:LDH2 family malate/lactate/ureidoglycolate dehydrogenase
MKIQVKEAEQLSLKILLKAGFCEQEAKYITESLLDAEMSGRKTHGLIRLLGFYKNTKNGEHNTEYKDLDIVNETSNSIYINGDKKLGFSVIYRSLMKAIPKAKQSKIVTVGIKNLSVTGYIGSYAKKAVEKDLIYIGFHNSSGGLVPHGANKELWGTNPITIGVPSNNIPVILDMASSYITWGELMVAKNENKKIREGVAVDKEGNITEDPLQVMDKGGLLPIAGHKGSGLAFIVELLAGALTGSGVGHQIPGGWGSFYILIDPSIFRDIKEFKNDVGTAIQELKESPKAKGFEEIYFAGEQSYNRRLACINCGEIDVNDKLLADLENLLK